LGAINTTSGGARASSRGCSANFMGRGSDRPAA
jgi:hypothetical protein